MPRTIEVLVSPQGQTTVQTKGYSGPDCLQASKFLEETLGNVLADRRTNEFYGTSQVQQTQENHA